MGEDQRILKLGQVLLSNRNTDIFIYDLNNKYHDD